MSKTRKLSLWLPRLSCERILRANPRLGPFALTKTESHGERLSSLNEDASRAGLMPAMRLADAYALCPTLETNPIDERADSRFLQTLARWARRYCPWVNIEGHDGLCLDITGAAHLFGGEITLAEDLEARLARAGFTARIAIASTRGAAWAFAHYGADRLEERIIDNHAVGETLKSLPVEALRIERSHAVELRRLGLKTIADVVAMPRKSLARRFDISILRRLDQAFGHEPESLSPLTEHPTFVTTNRVFEPIGYMTDIRAMVRDCLQHLVEDLREHEKAARIYEIRFSRVDHHRLVIALELARPLCDVEAIMRLFARHEDSIAAGFGIDEVAVEAKAIEIQKPVQITSYKMEAENERFFDVLTHLGNRIGLENIVRFLPVDCHIPERSYTLAPVAFTKPAHVWSQRQKRPLVLFSPEPVDVRVPGIGTYTKVEPPLRFRWRRLGLTTARATGPERLLPEWWLDDPNWRSGTRDYWRVETREGRRLWLFYTPQSPNWYVHGEFA